MGRAATPVHDVYARDAEVAFEPLELFDVNRADDVDDGQLLRLDGEYRHPLDLAPVGRHVDLRVLFVRVERLDVNDARPALPLQLLAQGHEVAFGELPLRLEFVALHVDALQAGNNLLDAALVRVFVGEDSGSELHQEAVNLNVDGLDRLRRETFEAVEPQATADRRARLRRRRGERGGCERGCRDDTGGGARERFGE